MEQRYEEDLKELKERMELSFEVLEEKRKIKVKELRMEINLYSHNYTNPPIPRGYEHVEGEWNTGFVIERKSDASQFVWIPVGSLRPNGTLDGQCFCEKFGRRNFLEWGSNTREIPRIMYKKDYYCNNYKEELKGELLKQLESVKRYGGFYVSRFLVSEGRVYNCETKKWKFYLQSKKGEKPYFYNMGFGACENDKDDIKGHLIFGAEYDSMLEWFLETKIITYEEFNSVASLENGQILYDRSVFTTGSNKTKKLNNIYDFGNVEEWTAEEAKETLLGDECYWSCIRRFYNPTLRQSAKVLDSVRKKHPEQFGARICLYLSNWCW
mgnify:CR=1 FL=1